MSLSLSGATAAYQADNNEYNCCDTGYNDHTLKSDAEAIFNALQPIPSSTEIELMELVLTVAVFAGTSPRYPDSSPARPQKTLTSIASQVTIKANGA